MLRVVGIQRRIDWPRVEQDGFHARQFADLMRSFSGCALEEDEPAERKLPASFPNRSAKVELTKSREIKSRTYSDSVFFRAPAALPKLLFWLFGNRMVNVAVFMPEEYGQ